MRDSYIDYKHKTYDLYTSELMFWNLNYNKFQKFIHKKQDLFEYTNKQNTYLDENCVSEEILMYSLISRINKKGRIQDQ